MELTHTTSNHWIALCGSGDSGYHAMNNKEKGSSQGCRMNAPTDLMRLRGLYLHRGRGWLETKLGICMVMAH